SAWTTSRRGKRSRNSSSSRSGTRASSQPHAIRPDADVAVSEHERLVADVRHGLLAPEPWLPSKYFYDDRGSQLFEEITRLPEYYQTRTEESILEAVAADIAAHTRARELVELGSGSGRKIRLLLDAMSQTGRLESCVLFD